MQDILLPLLVINLLLTVWLLRQHILRQGRRHRRREELAEWRSHIDLRIKQHFETLVNQSEIFVEHRSAMAEINKDHYALNERLDGISVYDIKAILAGQERLRMLESAIEAIKKDKSADHTLISLERRASKIELAIDSIETTIDDFGRRFNDLWALRNEVKRIEELVVGNAKVANLWMAEVYSEIAVLKKNFSGS